MKKKLNDMITKLINDLMREVTITSKKKKKKKKKIKKKILKK